MNFDIGVSKLRSYYRTVTSIQYLSRRLTLVTVLVLLRSMLEHCDDIVVRNFDIVTHIGYDIFTVY